MEDLDACYFMIPSEDLFYYTSSSFIYACFPEAIYKLPIFWAISHFYHFRTTDDTLSPIAITSALVDSDDSHT